MWQTYPGIGNLEPSGKRQIGDLRRRERWEWFPSSPGVSSALRNLGPMRTLGQLLPIPVTFETRPERPLSQKRLNLLLVA